MLLHPTERIIQGSFLSSKLVNIFIKDVEVGKDITKLADELKLWVLNDSLKDKIGQ